MKNSGFVLLLLAASAILSVGSGCAWVKKVTNTESSGDSQKLAAEDNARVRVTDAEGGEMIVTVYPSGNNFSKQGVGYLRVRDWDNAINSFKQALPKKESKNAARDYFALGAAYEAKGDAKSAMEHYQTAARLKNDAVHDEAFNRAEAKSKRVTSAEGNGNK